jgi:hypothetical protein
MERYGLVTWTTYRTWRPGDERGFVGGIRNLDGEHEIHNQLRADYDGKRRGLALFAARSQGAAAVRNGTGRGDWLRAESRERASDVFSRTLIDNSEPAA